MINLKPQIITMLTFLAFIYIITGINAIASENIGTPENASQINISSCQDLNQSDTHYKLNKSVSSEGTCFNILADNITLDCNGNTINYSQNTTGSAVSVEDNDYITITNCNIIQYRLSSNSHAINHVRSNNGLIENNTITTYGEGNGVAISIRDSEHNTISNNKIKTYGNNSNTIRLSGTNRTNVSGNILTTYGKNSLGIEQEYQSMSNRFSNNSIVTEGPESKAIKIDSYGLNIISYNIINTSGKNSQGVYFTKRAGNITHNNINTMGPYSSGIQYKASSVSNISWVEDKNNILENKITAKGNHSPGISIDDRLHCGGQVCPQLYKSEQFSKNNISRNIIKTSGSYGNGIEVLASTHSYISENDVSTSGNNSHGIQLLDSHDSIISTNTISTSGLDAYGTRIIWSRNNSIIGDSILSEKSSDYSLENAGSTNTFQSTNFTAPRKIYFFDNESWFNYNNESDDDIWLETKVNSGEITRELLNWSKTLLVWNETNSTPNTTVTYNVTGLIPDSQYQVFRTSNRHYFYPAVYPYPPPIKTDSDGNLPQFTILLDGETRITLRVIAVPPDPPIAIAPIVERPTSPSRGHTVIHNPQPKENNTNEENKSLLLEPETNETLPDDNSSDIDDKELESKSKIDEIKNRITEKDSEAAQKLVEAEKAFESKQYALALQLAIDAENMLRENIITGEIIDSVDENRRLDDQMPTTGIIVGLIIIISVYIKKESIRSIISKRKRIK